MELFETLKKIGYPEKSGLDYQNEFTFIVAILLSAQANDKFINTQTIEFFKIASTPEQMIKLGVGGIQSYIHKIGLWRNKSENIMKLSQKIVELKALSKPEQQNWHASFEHVQTDDDLTIYGDEIISPEGLPSFRLGLMQLAGIGRKSANAFLNVVYKAPVITVDTHVIRVSQRLDLAHTSDPFKIEEELKDSVPAEYHNAISHWLVWHGRTLCNARNPKCAECPLKEWCLFFRSLQMLQKSLVEIK